jgi:hypothetical protein
MRLMRDLQAQVFAADIRAQSTILAATDQSVASKLSTVSAGFTASSSASRRFRWSRRHRQYPFRRTSRRCGEHA